VSDNRKINVKGQLNLLDDLADKPKEDVRIQEINEFPKKTKLKLEKEVLGFYISDHPLSDLGDRLHDFVNFTTDYKDHIDDTRIYLLDNKFVSMAEVITN